MRRGILLAGLSAVTGLVLSGCASSAGAEPASASRTIPAEKKAEDKAVPFNKDPYPSTYKAYPGEPTAIINATVHD
jgi:hypothetical protein